MVVLMEHCGVQLICVNSVVCRALSHFSHNRSDPNYGSYHNFMFTCSITLTCYVDPILMYTSPVWRALIISVYYVPTAHKYGDKSIPISEISHSFQSCVLLVCGVTDNYLGYTNTTLIHSNHSYLRRN